MEKFFLCSPPSDGKGWVSMDFNFYMPVRVVSGEGCLRGAGGPLREMGRRCLVVTGGHSAQMSGALGDLLDTLREAGVEATVFPGISANPLISQCQAAAFAAEACRAQFLVGVGGGSVMDAVKATAWLAANSAGDGGRLFQEDGLRHPPLPFALVGTTAGTGSEVSAAAVLTDDRTGRKRSVTHPHCFARVVFADPRYTDSMPRATTVSTALDALAHAAEGWFAPACGDVVTAFGEKALPMLCDGLRALAASEAPPSKETRDRLFYGSLWAGMVLCATGTAFPHPLGYVLTEDFGVPHGMACAAFQPAFLRRAERFAPERAQALFALCGGRDAYFSLLDALVDVRQVRMTADQADGYASRWTNVKNFARTPGGFTAQEGVALLRELFVR